MSTMMKPTSQSSAFLSSYAPRLRQYSNSLVAPVIQPTTNQALPTSRTTKRGTTIISYAEDQYDDDFDGDGPRRPTGLRSLRAPDTTQDKPESELGIELTAPIQLQGQYRDWVGFPHFKLAG
jgi:chromatin structure-remodeling complex subunit SFH1